MMKYVGPGGDAYHVGREKRGAFRRPYQAYCLEWMGSMPDVYVYVFMDSQSVEQ